MTLDDLGRDGAQRVRLLGSFARGDAREDSDVDFFVRRRCSDGGSQEDYCSVCKRNWVRVDVAEESSLDPLCETVYGLSF
jgi:predicted nucleotidyltransferase